MLKFNTGFENTMWCKLIYVVCFAIGPFSFSVKAQDTEKKVIEEKETADASDPENKSENKSEKKASIDEVRKLIKELDGKSLKERDAAEKSLIESGPSILGYLPEVDANTSGEMKIRLQRIRQQLQTVEIKTYFEYSKVTLSGKMPLPEAIEVITKQTGNKIMLEGENAFDSVEVELDEKDSPFWTVMDKLMAQAKLRANPFASDDGLTLVSGGQEATSESPKPYSTGPFHIEVSSIQSSLPFGSRLDGQLDLSLMVSWEPRLKPIYVQIPMATLQATSDDGKTLASSSPESAPDVPLNNGGCLTQIDLQLQRPSRAATKLSKLSGEFVFAVPGDKHKYIFKKFGNGARQSEKFGETTVTLEGARRNGKVFEMRVLVELGNDQGALDSFRSWMMSNEAYLLDPKERRLENVGFNQYGANSNSAGIAFLFQINGNPDEFQFVYEAPGTITKQTVKYELQDINLP